MADCKNFIILYTAKVGSTALVSNLDASDRIDIIKSGDYEPFDRVPSGRMTFNNLRKTWLDIFSRTKSTEEVNCRYLETAKHPICDFNKERHLGFKVRYISPRGVPEAIKQIGVLSTIWKAYLIFRFTFVLHAVASKHDIPIIFIIRKNVLKWSLSQYHGAGDGSSGHLQFKVASGKIKTEDIPGIQVDLQQLDKIIKECINKNSFQRKYLRFLRLIGLKADVVFYEDFVGDKKYFFEDFSKKAHLSLSNRDIEEIIGKGTKFKKVHSENISDFVHNHEEVLAKYGCLQDVF